MKFARRYGGAVADEKKFTTLNDNLVTISFKYVC